MPSSDSDRDPDNNRVARGRRFEQQAAEYLRRLGFGILEQNWQAGHKEIDLIVASESLVVFVEVKASRTAKFGHPAEWVDATKRQRLWEAAQIYLAGHNVGDRDIRFDVITFFEGKLEHYPDAFRGE
jgi:putative endonuclease